LDDIEEHPKRLRQQKSSQAGLPDGIFVEQSSYIECYRQAPPHLETIVSLASTRVPAQFTL
jgi:hypothetical protein